MNIREVSMMPTSIERNMLKDTLDEGCSGIHESTTRAFHIVRKVRELLEQNVPPKVVLEIMDLMEGK